jgi:two-component sensor histidine kinase
MRQKTGWSRRAHISTPSPSVDQQSTSYVILMRLLTWLAPVARLPATARYVLTFLLVLAFLGLRLATEAHLHSFPFLVFFPAIIIAALVFDRGSGVVATVLSGLASTYFFVEPRYSLAIPDVSTGISLALFLAVGLFLSGLIEALRGAVTRLASANARLGEAERQAETLLRELNHRIRNDLHAILVLLRQQQRAHPEEPARAVIEAVSERIRLLSRVYSQLQRQQGEAFVDTSVFIDGLSKDLETSLAGTKPIVIRTEAEALMLPLVQAVPFGLIINELVTNAVKHAFPNERAGAIDIQFRQYEGEIKLRIADDGVGLSAEPRAGAQGRRLVEALVQQLGGTLSVESPPGAIFTVRVPIRI